MNQTNTMSVGELADAAGVSRRAVRFYVQRGLLEAPEGRGRGSRYSAEHLERLRKIHELQEAGHSLEAIRRILVDGESARVPERARRRGVRGRGARGRGARPAVNAGLWTRVTVGDGIEVHIDLSRHQPRAEDLLLIKEAIASVLKEAAAGGRSRNN